MRLRLRGHSGFTVKIAARLQRWQGQQVNPHAICRSKEIIFAGARANPRRVPIKC
jgi:hypothetical protein